MPDAVTKDVVLQVPLPTTESTAPVAGFLVATKFPVYVTLAKTAPTFSFPRINAGVRRLFRVTGATPPPIVGLVAASFPGIYHHR